MIEITGDLFAQDCDAIVIPTNRTVKANGEAVMGAGVAKEAARRWPWLPAKYGKELERTRTAFLYNNLGAVIGFRCNPVYDPQPGPKFIITFNTKGHWKEDAQTDLIDEGARQLQVLAKKNHWQHVCLPRLGCGLGRLDWETTVKPILEKHLDDWFVVVSRGN